MAFPWPAENTPRGIQSEKLREDRHDFSIARGGHPRRPQSLTKKSKRDPLYVVAGRALISCYATRTAQASQLIITQQSAASRLHTKKSAPRAQHHSTRRGLPFSAPSTLTIRTGRKTPTWRPRLFSSELLVILRKSLFFSREVDVQMEA